MATEAAVLLLVNLKLNLRPGVFTILDLHKMDMQCSTRSWLGWWTLEAGGVAANGAECSLLPQCPSLLLNRVPGAGPFHFFYWKN
eukprot:1149797-Pelagomonas_calceolata.AAC.1